MLHDCVRLAGLRDSYVEMITTRGLAPAGSRELYWAAHEDPKYTTPVNYREAAVETG